MDTNNKKNDGNFVENFSNTKPVSLKFYQRTGALRLSPHQNNKEADRVGYLLLELIPLNSLDRVPVEDTYKQYQISETPYAYDNKLTYKLGFHHLMALAHYLEYLDTYPFTLVNGSVAEKSKYLWMRWNNEQGLLYVAGDNFDSRSNQDLNSWNSFEDIPNKTNSYTEILMTFQYINTLKLFINNGLLRIHNWI